MLNILVVLSGMPACGKTTYRKKLAVMDFDVVCPDDIREELYGNASIQGDGEKVFECAHKRLKLIGCRCGNAIFDATNLTAQRRKELIEIMRPYYDTIICHYFRPNFEKSVEQNEKRERKVPKEVIRRMCYQWEEPTVAEGFDYVAEIKY